MGADPRDLMARAAAMRSDRATLIAHADEIKTYIRPDSTEIQNTTTPGAKRRAEVLDNTAEDACELLAGALHGTLTNPASKWFFLKPQDGALMRDLDVRTWLHAATEEMLAVFASPRAFFAPQIHEVWADVVAYGTGTLAVFDRPGDLPLFASRPLAEIMIAENAEGRVDTWFRAFKLPAREAYKKWGAKAGADVVKAVEKPATQDQLFEFLHAVYPRADADPKRKDQRGKPWASCWVNQAEGLIMAEGGYDESPYITGRWAKAAGEIYGRGPGMKALPDTKMLQRMMGATIAGAELAIRPPLMVPDDGVIGPIRLRPASLTKVRSDLMLGNASPIRSMTLGAQPDIGEMLMEQVRKRIERAFYSHLIQLDQDPKMTATQVVELSERALQVMGPMMGRLQAEVLGPLIDRVFAVMFRGGAFGEPPRRLRGADLAIEYVSPISRAQRAGDAVAIMRTREAVHAIAQSAPQVLDNFDADGEAIALADLYGYPPNLQKKPADVQAARDERARLQAEQKKGLEALAMADAAGKAAPMLKAIQGGAPAQAA